MGAGASAAATRVGGGMPKELRLAVLMGDLDEMKANMDHLGTRDGRGWTSLHWACWLGQFHIVDWMLKQEKVDIDAVAKPNSITPLLLAAWGGHFRIVTLLVKRGADVELGADASGNNVLSAALHQGRWIGSKCMHCQEWNFAGPLYRCSNDCKDVKGGHHFDMCEPCFKEHGHPPDNGPYFMAHDVERWDRPGDAHSRLFPGFSTELDDRSDKDRTIEDIMDLDYGQKSKLVSMKSLRKMFNSNMLMSSSMADELQHFEESQHDVDAILHKEQAKIKANARKQQLTAGTSMRAKEMAKMDNRLELSSGEGGRGARQIMAGGEVKFNTEKRILHSAGTPDGLEAGHPRSRFSDETMEVAKSAAGIANDVRTSATDLMKHASAMVDMVDIMADKLGVGDFEVKSEASDIVAESGWVEDAPVSFEVSRAVVSARECTEELYNLVASSKSHEELPGYYECVCFFLQLGVKSDFVVRRGMHRITAPLLALGWKNSSLAILDTLENRGCNIDLPLHKPFYSMVDVAKAWLKFPELQYLGHRGHDISDLVDEIFTKISVGAWYRADA